MLSSQSITIPRYYSDTFVLVLFVILFAIQRPETLLGCYALSAFYVFFNWKLLSIKKSFFLMYLWFVLLCIPAVSLFNHSSTPLMYLILSPLLVLFASVYSTQGILAITKSLKYLFWTLVALTFIGVFSSDSAEPLEGLIPGTSTNGIPSYIIVIYIAYAIASILSAKYVSTRGAIATLSIAIIGLGRGSIIIATLLLFFSFCFKAYTSKVRFAYKFSLFFTLTFVFISYIVYNITSLQLAAELVIESSKFANGVLDEHRARILADYMDKINWLQLLLGADYGGTSIVTHYGGNPHNSYIRVHSFYGIWGLISVFLPFTFIFLKKIKWQYKISILFLILCALARALTEPIFFPSMLDFFYILYFIMFFSHYNALHLRSD
jgi:hypothetical protein